MKTADSTTVARQFGQFLNLAEAGQSIRITKHGRHVARLVPDRDFMPGKEAAAFFAGHKADGLDRQAANEIEKNIAVFKKHAREKILAH